MLLMRGIPCEQGTYWAGATRASVCVSPLNPSSLLEWLFNPTTADLHKALWATVIWLLGLVVGLLLSVIGMRQLGKK